MAAPLTADRLLAALKAEGVRVAEHPGWRTHNRDAANQVGLPSPAYGISRTDLLICIKCLGLLIRILTAHIIGDQ